MKVQIKVLVSWNRTVGTWIILKHIARPINSARPIKSTARFINSSKNKLNNKIS